jgi:hypothetical protein
VRDLFRGQLYFVKLRLLNTTFPNLLSSKNSDSRSGSEKGRLKILLAEFESITLTYCGMRRFGAHAIVAPLECDSSQECSCAQKKKFWL